jgi:hypothetical protein
MTAVEQAAAAPPATEWPTRRGTRFHWRDMTLEILEAAGSLSGGRAWITHIERGSRVPFATQYRGALTVFDAEPLSAADLAGLSKAADLALAGDAFRSVRP